MRRPIVLALSILSIVATLVIPVLAEKAEEEEFRSARQPTRPGDAESARQIAGPVYMPPRVYNRVIALLDEEVFLSTAENESVWESEPFNTSQFNRIGIRVSGETERGHVICSVGWRYTQDETFKGSVPMAMVARPNNLGSDPGLRTNRRPDGVEDLYVRDRMYYPWYPTVTPVTDFAEVRGLEAVVRCMLSNPRVDYGTMPIGDDPGIGGEPPEPADVTASLTDVKVLLRRE